MIPIEDHRKEMIEKKTSTVDDRNTASIAEVRAIGCFNNSDASPAAADIRNYLVSFPNLHQNAVTNVTPGVYPHRRHGTSQQVPEMISK